MRSAWGQAFKILRFSRLELIDIGVDRGSAQRYDFDGLGAQITGMRGPAGRQAKQPGDPGAANVQIERPEAHRPCQEYLKSSARQRAFWTNRLPPAHIKFWESADCGFTQIYENDFGNPLIIQSYPAVSVILSGKMRVGPRESFL
jgi:hypothetical protein